MRFAPRQRLRERDEPADAERLADGRADGRDDAALQTERPRRVTDLGRQRAEHGARQRVERDRPEIVDHVRRVDAAMAVHEVRIEPERSGQMVRHQVPAELAALVELVEAGEEEEPRRLDRVGGDDQAVARRERLDRRVLAVLQISYAGRAHRASRPAPTRSRSPPPARRAGSSASSRSIRARSRASSSWRRSGNRSPSTCRTLRTRVAVVACRAPDRRRSRPAGRGSARRRPRS